jgi:uncharacterized protein YjiS (DUF1127 family)
MLNDRGFWHPHATRIEALLLLPEGAARATVHRLFTRMRVRWRAYWEWRARRATAELLHHLDDRALHDIGISRGEIDRTVYGCVRSRSPNMHAPGGCHSSVDCR